MNQPCGNILDEELGMTAEVCDLSETCTPCEEGEARALPDGAEALIAVDTRACITDMNWAACRALGAHLDRLIGRPILDAVASPALCTLILGALISPGPCEARVALNGEPEQRVLARAEPLLDERGEGVGGLLVLTVHAL
jgi:PAS domain-containing protein